MKILLASNGNFLIKDGYKSLGIPIDEVRIGYIITASNAARDRDYLERHKQAMTQAGYSFEEFDIEGKSKEEMLKFFADKNVIHVEGGNTFYLLKVIRETGFGEVLKILLDKGLAYVGSSAGAYVMCPTIEVSDWDETGRNRFGITDFTALGYVPFSLKVHYTDDMKNKVQERMRNLKYPLRILRDGQGIINENGESRFIGEGEEVKLAPLGQEINERRNQKIF